MKRFFGMMPVNEIERFDNAMREAIEKYINENHINFNEEEN